eukprot:792150-Rhodomonas_salina.1
MEDERIDQLATHSAGEHSSILGASPSCECTSTPEVLIVPNTSPGVHCPLSLRAESSAERIKRDLANV